MSPSEILLYLAIAALVVWRVIIRQLRGSTLTARGLVVVPGILVIAGIVTCAPVVSQSSGGEIGLLVAEVVLLSALGVARAASTRLSAPNGYAVQKGTTLTLVLWLVTIALRVGVAVLGSQLGMTGPLTSKSILLSMGATIGVQNAVVYLRARRRGLTVATDRTALSVRS
jgi:hypothetical protein